VVFAVPRDFWNSGKCALGIEFEGSGNNWLCLPIFFSDRQGGFSQSWPNLARD